MAAGGTPPAWRQGYDALERQLTPLVESAVRSEQFAIAVGLAARLRHELQEQTTKATRRVLHGLNLPAGTDITRILNEIGRLQRQVGELTAELDATRAELATERRRTGRGGRDNRDGQDDRDDTGKAPSTSTSTTTRRAPARRRKPGGGEAAERNAS